MKNEALPITDEINMHYLLELMPPLHSIPEYALLPELFSIIGIDSLLSLCKYAGGEIVKIPTLSELSDSITALDMFYTKEISHKDYLGAILNLGIVREKIGDIIIHDNF